MRKSVLQQAEESHQRVTRERESTRAARYLERRIAYCSQQLAAHPERRYQWHAAGGPLMPEPGEPVSVVLAVRLATGQVVAGELSIPRERFDGAAVQAFLDGVSHE